MCGKAPYLFGVECPTQCLSFTGSESHHASEYSMKKRMRSISPRTRRVSVKVYRVREVESVAEVVLAIPVMVTNTELEEALVNGDLDEVLLSLDEWKDVPGSKAVRLGHGGVQDLKDAQREPHAVLWTDKK